MSLAPGAASVPTRSSRRSGAGGMGEVWRARDTSSSAMSRSRLSRRSSRGSRSGWPVSSGRRGCSPRSTTPTSPRSTASRKSGRLPVPGPRARRGRDARREARGGAAAGRGGARGRAQIAAGARGRPRSGRHPPRFEARRTSRCARTARSRSSTSAWPRAAEARGPTSDCVGSPTISRRHAAGRDPRHRRLHEPRAGPGPRRSTSAPTSCPSAASSTNA